jgi:hypothetical protein
MLRSMVFWALYATVISEIFISCIWRKLRFYYEQNSLYDGHAGPLYIILPESYAGPKEKFILKGFTDYHGWYGSMLSDNYVMYAAK